MTTLLVMYVVFGLLLAVLAIPLWLQKIGRNGLYGFRVKRTLENDEVWYAVNEYFAPWMMAAGLSTAVSAVVLYGLPGISLDAYSLSVLVVFSVIFTVGIVATVRFMKSLD
jgi:uncharacterized membrane protein